MLVVDPGSDQLGDVCRAADPPERWLVTVFVLSLVGLGLSRQQHLLLPLVLVAAAIIVPRRLTAVLGRVMRVAARVVDLVREHDHRPLGRSKNHRKLVVTGCMAERYGAELADALPEVDRVAGFGVPVHLAPVLTKAGKKSIPVSSVPIPT